MEATQTGSLSHKKLGFDPGYLAEFENKVFIEGAQSSRKLVNFFVLLLLATVIATYGLLSQSTATVIGAMIVAPLMAPIMATTAAVVMGSGQRTLRSLALTLVGIAAVIGLSALLAMIIPDLTISFETNPELASRISPGLYALATALGAGAAGAFIVSRSEIADSMGGVAIAISLVPPLCVVGIALSQADWSSAAGAMLLFITNFVAILLAGGLTFMILGLGGVAIRDEQVRLRRRSFFLIALGTLLVVIPLSITSFTAIKNTMNHNIATRVVQEWLADSESQLSRVVIENETVFVTVEGTGNLKPLRTLVADLSSALNQPVVVTLRVIPAWIEVSGNQAAP